MMSALPLGVLAQDPLEVGVTDMLGHLVTDAGILSGQLEAGLVDTVGPRFLDRGRITGGQFQFTGRLAGGGTGRPRPGPGQRQQEYDSNPHFYPSLLPGLSARWGRRRALCINPEPSPPLSQPPGCLPAPGMTRGPGVMGGGGGGGGEREPIYYTLSVIGPARPPKNARGGGGGGGGKSCTRS